MLKAGRWKIALGPCFWVQAQVPTRVYSFLFLSLLREARADDIDKNRKFPLGTELLHNGRRYYYGKKATREEQNGK